MDERRAIYKQQRDHVVNDPNVPDDVKILFQNLVGAIYHNGCILEMTIASNQTLTLTPFANLNSTVNLDFHAWDGKEQMEEMGNADFRRFRMPITVDGTQLIQAMLYTKRDLVVRYITQKQAATFKHMFKNLVTVLREQEGALTCAGVPNHLACNKSNLVILICQLESEGKQYVCGVPMCKGHVRVNILTGKKMYLLAQPIVDQLISNAEMDVDGDKWMIEENDDEFN